MILGFVLYVCSWMCAHVCLFWLATCCRHITQDRCRGYSGCRRKHRTLRPLLSSRYTCTWLRVHMYALYGRIIWMHVWMSVGISRWLFVSLFWKHVWCLTCLAPLALPYPSLPHIMYIYMYECTGIYIHIYIHIYIYMYICMYVCWCAFIYI